MSRQTLAIVIVFALLASFISQPTQAAQPTTLVNGQVDACGRSLDRTQSYTEGCDNPQPPPPSHLLVDRFEDTVVIYDPGSWPEAVDINDVDGDGDNEIVSTTTFYFDPEHDDHVWILNRSAGFTWSVVYSRTASAGDPESLETGDFDGNGRIDLVTGNAYGNNVDVYFNTAAGWNFTRRIYTTGDTPYALTAWDNPGLITDSFALTNWNDVVASIYKWNGTTMVRTDRTAPSAGWNHSASGDVTGDGCPDYVAMWGQSSGVPQFSVYRGDCVGGVGSRTDYPRYNNQLPNAIGVGDVNNDGRLDVVTGVGGNRPNVWAVVYLQQANGTLAFDAAYPSYDIPESVDIQDVDCDGLKDVVVDNAGWNAFSWFKQLNDGTLDTYQLEPYPFYHSHVGPNGVDMGDVNGDGLKDFVLGNYNYGYQVALQRACVPATPTPTVTPLATNTPYPTNTPLPTGTSLPTYTPYPTYTPAATNTPQPTYTPLPTYTVAPPTYRLYVPIAAYNAVEP